MASRFHNIRKLLQPGFATEAIKLGEISSILASLVSGNPIAMTASIGTFGVRRLSRELLINPALQNPIRKMATAIKNNSPALAKSAFNSFKIELRRGDIPDEILDKFQEIDPEEFLKLIEINQKLKKEK